MRPTTRSAEHHAEIPLTVVGGCSGAGKSSIIQHVLETRHNRGPVAVVRHVLPNADGQREQTDDPRLEWIEGTLAFSSQDPSDVLLHLASLETRPDHVIVEADCADSPQRMTGFAYMPGFRPDGVITVVDAAAAHQEGFQHGLDQVARDQLRRADIVVMNKIDLVGPRAAGSTQRMLSRLAPSARFVWSEHGRVAPSVLLGEGLDRSAGEGSVTAAWRPDYLPVASRTGGSPLGERCRAWCLVASSSISSREFRAWVARLPDIVVRGSGVVWLMEEPQHRYNFFLMGGRWHLNRGAPWGNTVPSTRLTVLTLGGEMRRVRHDRPEDFGGLGFTNPTGPSAPTLLPPM